MGETERCVKIFGKPTGGMSSYISTLSESESLSGSECMKHYHEVIDKHSRDEYCFSRIPLLEKIRSGMTLPELKNLPESFSIERPMPVECKPYSIHGAGSGNSLY